MTEEATRVNNYKTNNKRFYSGSTVALQRTKDERWTKE